MYKKLNNLPIGSVSCQNFNENNGYGSVGEESTPRATLKYFEGQIGDEEHCVEGIPQHLSIPFRSDGEFIELHELSFIMQSIILKIQKSLSDLLIKDASSFERSGKILSLMTKIKDSLSDYTNFRLKFSVESGIFVPRIIRLVNKLGLQGKFVDAIIYVVVAHSGCQFPNVESGNIATASFIAWFCELNHYEHLSFLS